MIKLNNKLLLKDEKYILQVIRCKQQITIPDIKDNPAKNSHKF